MSSKLSIRAVVFDLDGLMFNTEHIFHHAGLELLRRRGHVMTPSIINGMLGRRPHEAFEHLIAELDLSESVETLWSESQIIFSDLAENQLAPMPGLFDLLERIEQRGLAKAVATSSPRRYLEDMLSRFELLHRFPLTLAAEDVTHGKPHPEIYHKAAELIGIETAEMLVLEDSETGTRSAAAAGAVVVSIPHEHTCSQDFSPADLIAASLHDPQVFQLLEQGMS